MKKHEEFLLQVENTAYYQKEFANITDSKSLRTILTNFLYSNDYYDTKEEGMDTSNKNLDDLIEDFYDYFKEEKENQPDGWCDLDDDSYDFE